MSQEILRPYPPIQLTDFSNGHKRFPLLNEASAVLHRILSSLGETTLGLRYLMAARRDKFGIIIRNGIQTNEGTIIHRKNREIGDVLVCHEEGRGTYVVLPNQKAGDIIVVNKIETPAATPETSTTTPGVTS